MGLRRVLLPGRRRKNDALMLTFVTLVSLQGNRSNPSKLSGWYGFLDARTLVGRIESSSVTIDPHTGKRLEAYIVIMVGPRTDHNKAGMRSADTAEFQRGPPAKNCIAAGDQWTKRPSGRAICHSQRSASRCICAWTVFNFSQVGRSGNEPICRLLRLLPTANIAIEIRSACLGPIDLL